MSLSTWIVYIQLSTEFADFLKAEDLPAHRNRADFHMLSLHCMTTFRITYPYFAKLVISNCPFQTLCTRWETPYLITTFQAGFAEASTTFLPVEVGYALLEQDVASQVLGLTLLGTTSRQTWSKSVDLVQKVRKSPV